MKDLDAKCQRLFELDAKRTQGWWSEQPSHSSVVGSGIIAQPDRAKNSFNVAFIPRKEDMEYLSAMPEAIAIIREYQKREKVMREALGFYAAMDRHPREVVIKGYRPQQKRWENLTVVDDDNGKKAEQALAQLGEVGR